MAGTVSTDDDPTCCNRGMDDADAVRFTLLGGETVDEDRLYELYAYPSGPLGASGAVVRANAITSLDGAATTAAGTSGGLGGPGDRRLFAIQRELADVVIVGMGTVRAENYGGVRLTAAQRQRRRARGQTEVPPIALVTRTGTVERDLAVLTENETPPLVLTSARAATEAGKRLGSAAVVLDCSGSDPHRVDLSVALERLTERGLRKVLTEGGPTLLGAFMDRDLLDELCLTCAPVVIGGAAVRIATGDADTFGRMHPAHAIADAEGYLYLRYTRVR